MFNDTGKEWKMGQRIYMAPTLERMWMYIMYVKNHITNSHNTLLMVIKSFFIFLENTILLIYLFGWSTQNFPSRDWTTLTPCSGRIETSPLDHPGSPPSHSYFTLWASAFFSSNSLSLCITFSQLFILKFFKPSESCKRAVQWTILSQLLSLLNQIETHTILYLNATGQIYWKQGHSPTQTQYHYKDLIITI